MDKPTIVYFGTPEFSAVLLQQLVDTGFSFLAVVTSPDKPKGRNGVLTPSPVKTFASEHGIEVLAPEKLRGNDTVLTRLQDLKPDLMLVFSYGKIIPDELLALPKFGALNVHPSLLPKYRGPSPIQNQILEGVAQTGVSIIKMTAEVDAGPIVEQTTFPIFDDDTFKSLAHKLADESAEMLISVIPRWISGQISPQTQDESQATSTKIIHKDDGFIELPTLEKLTADELSRKIRAYYPWPGVWTRLEDGKVLKLLPNDMVQLEGKSPISAKQFVSGHPQFGSLLPNPQ